jgi:Domain of unknown function (DUF1839)
VAVTSAGGRQIVSLSGQDPRAYRRHLLHAIGRRYLESNCYSDIIIELLHACGYEPLAVFGSLVRMDFEGDQWTFFKPPPEDLEALFGVDIHEMQPYRPLPEQIAEQLERGRTIIVELDSWYLPDTAATSYRAQHVKTSVAADAIDPGDQTLHYFHGPGLFQLSGEDYRGIFRIGADDPAALPPYTEIVRFDAGARLEGEELRAASLAALRRHLQRRPRHNPFEVFGEQLGRELPTLLAGDLDTFHGYAFATVRMAGSAFEIAADYARWLFGAEADGVAATLEQVVDGCKTLSFRLARRRPFDPEPLIAALADGWSRGIGDLAGLAG